ncbi:MAG: amidohydrolase family protein [Bacteroidetes bacterium]|nr:amidohydrolase family protein [Bacteroidota bacterium]
MKIHNLSLILFLLSAWHLASAQVSFDKYALTNVSIIDANNTTPRTGQTVLVAKGYIIDIFNDESKPIPDSFTIIKLDKKYLLPGLVDAHVHFATDPSGVDNRAHTLGVLQNMLYSGVTSVRDMAGDARVLAGLSRDALTGDIISPDIYYAALMAGPEFFDDPRTATATRGAVAGKMPYMLAVTDSTDLTLAVAEAKGTGATGLKLYADLSPSLVKKIVAAAQKQNITVWAHAWLQKANPSDVVRSGVAVISHAPLLIHDKMDTVPSSWKHTLHDKLFWDKVTPDFSSLFQEMKEHNTILDATLLTYKKWAEEDSTMWYDYELGKRITRQAYKAGILIDAGTDDDQVEFVQKEIELLVKEAGFRPVDAIIAATLNGAKALRIDALCGTVSIHKRADFLILNKNPLENISNIESVDMVIKQGKIFKR